MQTARRQKAFTLIETMVVVIIIGVVLAVALLSLNLFNGARKTKATAKQLETVIEQAKQEAILLPAVLSLKVDNQGYRFLRYTQHQWKPLKHDDLSRSKAFSSGLQVAVKTEGRNKNIVFSASGEVSPFTLFLSDRRHTVKYQLQLTEDGGVSLKNITKTSHDA